jgi:hypothetical protein
MSRKLVLAVVACAFVCMPLASAWAELIHYPNETAYYDSTKAYAGVHLFTPQSSIATYLIDLDGRLVHKWVRATVKTAADSSNIWYATLEENGMLSRAITPPLDTTKDQFNVMTGGGVHGLLEEVNWYGNVAHSINCYTSTFRAHHRYDRIYNKTLKKYTYLVMAWEKRAKAEAQAIGAQNSLSANGWSSDSIYELDINGNVVWKWSLYDHTCQSADSSITANYVADVFNAPTKFDVNALSSTRNGPIADWIHINSLGYNPTTGHIVVNSREYNECFVIDHDGTFTSATDWAGNIALAAGIGGDFKYRFGNPSDYNAPNFTAGAGTYTTRPLFQNWACVGANGAVQMWGAHGCHFIKPTFYKNGPAMPGAGNILIMDNHACNGDPLAGFSRLIEVNPYVTGAPSATNPPVFPTQGTYKFQHDGVGYHQVAVAGLGYANAPSQSGIPENQSNQIVWKFQPNNVGSFSSSHISGVQRVPNGNTIGTSGEAGSIFELTAGSNSGTSPEAWAGTSPALVWNYTNPMTMTTTTPGDNRTRKMVPTKFSLNPTISSTWQIFCSFRYDVNFPGLKGKVVQYADGTIQPIMQQVGVGTTLTGQVPCRSIPCQYVGTP